MNCDTPLDYVFFFQNQNGKLVVCPFIQGFKSYIGILFKVRFSQGSVCIEFAVFEKLPEL